MAVSFQSVAYSSKRLPSRHLQDEGDVEYDDLKKPAKKSRGSVVDDDTNISGGFIKESSTPPLPLDAFMVVMEFLHPRVRTTFMLVIINHNFLS